jgi:leader peptidase (prepilin peptidase)/N-methyltransferase
VPILSWLFLRGRCSGCKTRISIRYPLIEALTGVLSVLLLLKCADGRIESEPLGRILIPYLFYFYFVCACLALAFIDLETALIPDVLTLPTALLGVVAAIAIPKDGAFKTLHPNVTWLASVIGLLAGAGVIWLIFSTYKRLTGRIGMGGGDLTTVAMIGAFLGWRSLMLVLFMASVQGIVVAVSAALWERVIGKEGGLLLRGVHRPEYWEPDGEETDTDVEGPEEDDEVLSFGKIGIPFGPFLVLGAIEYLFIGGLLEAFLMRGV